MIKKRGVKEDGHGWIGMEDEEWNEEEKEKSGQSTRDRKMRRKNKGWRENKLAETKITDIDKY